MDAKKFEQAAAAAGIAAKYINARGQPEAVSAETREKLLAAMAARPTAGSAPLPPVRCC